MKIELERKYCYHLDYTAESWAEKKKNLENLKTQKTKELGWKMTHKSNDATENWEKSSKNVKEVKPESEKIAEKIRFPFCFLRLFCCWGPIIRDKRLNWMLLDTAI